jgi:quinol-cytochrome oxidoreductase complex cytochrome b subunit
MEEQKQMETKPQETFFPTFLFKEMVVALILFFIVIGLAWYFPAEMGDPADPTDSSFVPKPEWYFLSMYQFLKLFPGKLEIIGLMLQPLMLLGLLLLPFLDRNPERRPGKRKTMMVALAGICVVAVILGVIGHFA